METKEQIKIKLQEISQDYINLQIGEYEKEENLFTRTMEIIKKFPNSNRFVLENNFSQIQFPSPDIEEVDGYKEEWEAAREKTLKYLSILPLQYEESSRKIEIDTEDYKKVYNVFLVHGHDNEMKKSVSNFVRKIEMNPIILHERANKGLTLIDKFESFGEKADFVISILSPDDIGAEKGRDVEELSFRARQNVVFETGYFMGKLSRSKVVMLYREDDNFEKPSDLKGLLYIAYNSDDKWELDIAREMISAGLKVKLEKMIE